MEILDPGHIYELAQLGSKRPQILTFVKRSGGSVHYDQEWPGLQTQEVLRALIDRTKYLYGILPCRETEEALVYLRMALYWYEVRAYRRKRSATNRTTEPHDDSQTPALNVEYAPDVPFTEFEIELREVGDDGHIIL